MSSGKILLGILAGAAAGAMMGILFAPEKGATTRKKILSKGEDYADDLKEKFSEFVDAVTDKYESTVHKVKEVVEKEPAKTEPAK